MITDHRQKQKQMENGERRGWIVYLLSIAYPSPMSFRRLLHQMDFYNFPLSHQRFADKLEFLRGLDLVRVFPIGAAHSLTSTEQAKLIQRFCSSDGDLDKDCLVTLTPEGVKFQEGYFEVDGILRVK